MPRASEKAVPEKLGRQTPTAAVVLPYTTTHGQEAIDLYNTTGRTAQQWQQLLLYDILAENEDGLWVHTKFGYSVPRRNGKNEIAAMRELYGLQRGENILHTAHRTTTSHAAWERLCSLLDKAKIEYRSIRASGRESIRLKSGEGRIEFRTRSSKGGLGEGFDLSYLDTLLIATPISWDGSITQQAGRLHRSHEGKQRVEIFDYVDLSIPMFARMYQKRLKTYAKLGYEVFAANDNRQDDRNILVRSARAVEALVNDIENASKSIFIAAPYASAACLEKLAAALADAATRGIALEISIASTPRDDVKAIFAEMNVNYLIKAEGRLCASVIDEETVWYGAIPLLAFPKKEDCSIRFKSSEVAAELLSEIQRKVEPEAAATNGVPPAVAVK